MAKNKTAFFEIKDVEVVLEKRALKDVSKYSWTIETPEDRNNIRIKSNINGKTISLQRFLKEKYIGRELNSFERVYLDKTNPFKFTNDTLMIK